MVVVLGGGEPFFQLAVKVCSDEEECATHTWLFAFADCGGISGILVYHGAGFVGHSVKGDSENGKAPAFERGLSRVLVVVRSRLRRLLGLR